MLPSGRNAVTSVPYVVQCFLNNNKIFIKKYLTLTLGHSIALSIIRKRNMINSTYSVNQLAKLAGVSVRTLHLYDQCGLLKPAFRTDAGYRQYDEAALLRLQ